MSSTLFNLFLISHFTSTIVLGGFWGGFFLSLTLQNLILEDWNRKEVRKTIKVGNHLSIQDGWTEKEVQIIKWISKWHNQILYIRLTHNSAIWIQLCVCRAGYQKPPLLYFIRAYEQFCSAVRAYAQKSEHATHIYGAGSAFPKRLKPPANLLIFFASCSSHFVVSFLNTPARVGSAHGGTKLWDLVKIFLNLDPCYCKVSKWIITSAGLKTPSWFPLSDWKPYRALE